MKKLLLLGGLRYLLPVIKSAHKYGYYVITCDYIPDNIAHKYSDKYENISIVDKEAVLKFAQKEKIDGIMSFAVDPGVVTAAYVAEKMGLPFQGSYESVCILQNKEKFRDFLTEHNFNVPKAKGFGSYEEALKSIDSFLWPVIVKPVDSAGSKGVTKVDKLKDLKKAVDFAISASLCGRCIIEEFLEKEGYSSDTDSFTVDGNLCYLSFSNQMFESTAANPYAPMGYSWPSTMPVICQEKLKSELQRLMDLLNMKTGIYNIETRICKDGKPYIMEVSPRGGGNRLAEMLFYATRTNLIDNAVRTSVGDEIDVLEQPSYYGYIAEIILHCDKKGKFKSLWIDPEIRNHNLVEEDLWVKKGDRVEEFTGANKAIGTLTLQFASQLEIEEAMVNYKKWLKIEMI
jgi:carbamoylphosphate synthase large subunit